MNQEELRKSIEPKSDQLNADDLLGNTKTITVTAVKRGDRDQPVIVHYEGDAGRPYKPCKSMRRLLVYIWGDSAKDWKGRSMALFNDPNVKFGGVKVGGIRISHMTNLEKEIEIALSVSRGKRAPYVVKPLNIQPQQDVFERFENAVKKCNDRDALNKLLGHKASQDLAAKDMDRFNEILVDHQERLAMQETA